MKRFSVVLIAVCAFALTGCATLFGGGSSQTVNLVPSDGKQHSVTVQAPGQDPYDVDIPKTISVGRSHKAIRVLVKDSEDGNIGPTAIKSKMNPWFIGDVVATSLLSSSIDFLTGAAWKYDETSTVNVTKESVEAAQKADEAKKVKKEKESDGANQ
ncbi:MAG: hypothetical protein J5556_02900 [Deltaproteobacteria bacterium]|nr:hypothetical protein [Deltaproteobacteria bacterium]